MEAVRTNNWENLQRTQPIYTESAPLDFNFRRDDHEMTVIGERLQYAGKISPPGLPTYCATQTVKRGSDEQDGECAERKRLRRKHNRQAAARSRHRQQERLQTLSREVDYREKKHFELKNEIRKLDKEKNHLSLVLSIHELKCPIRASSHPRTGERDLLLLPVS